MFCARGAAERARALVRRQTGAEADVAVCHLYSRNHSVTRAEFGSGDGLPLFAESSPPGGRGKRGEDSAGMEHSVARVLRRQGQQGRAVDRRRNVPTESMRGALLHWHVATCRRRPCDRPAPFPARGRYPCCLVRRSLFKPGVSFTDGRRRELADMVAKESMTVPVRGSPKVCTQRVGNRGFSCRPKGTHTISLAPREFALQTLGVSS